MFTPSDETLSSESSQPIVVTITNPPAVPNNKTITTSEIASLDTPTTILLTALEGVQSGVPTRTTATLTPTTLRNIEQLFETPLHPPEAHSNQAGFVPPPVQPFSVNTFVDSKSWGGGIATLTSIDLSSDSSRPSTTSPLPSSSSSMPSVNTTISTSISSLTSSTPSTGPPLTKRPGGRRPLKDDRISPEEEERRRLRRERNKQAAARCRKRRLDQTNTLQGETDILEEKRMSLQQEIHHLKQQKDELEFLLAAHKNSCKMETDSSPASIKLEPIDAEESISSIEQPPPPLKPQRPTSLAVVPFSKGVSELGITIETPSNALRGMGLNFDSMMEGGTGLTPVSVIPLESTGLTPLTTPVVNVTTAPSINNCSSQQRSSSSDISSPDGAPPKLVSL